MDQSVSVSYNISTDSIRQEKFPESFNSYEDFRKCLKDSLTKHNLPLKLSTEHNIVRGELLGAGSFGEVIKATIGGETIAIKLLSSIDFKLNCDTTIKTILNEIVAMCQIQHERIPKFYGVYQDEVTKEVGLMIEFIEGKTLHDYIHGKNWGEHNDKGEKLVVDPNHVNPLNKEICRLMIELTEVVVALHEKNVIHRDLKPKNVMVTKEGKIYLLDFGIARINDGVAGFTLSKKFTPLYCPPEGVTDNSEDSKKILFKITPKFDVWSLGVMLFEFFNQEKPWKKYPDTNKILVALKSRPEEIYKHFDEKRPEYDVICGCCQEEIDYRFDSKELLEKLRELYEKL